MRISSADGDDTVMRKGIVIVRVPRSFIMDLRVVYYASGRKRDAATCAFLTTGMFLNATLRLHYEMTFTEVGSNLEF